jgi:uncharacterized ion transporter superfamily protein YfcC
LATPAGVKPLMAIWSPFLISAAASAAVIRVYDMVIYYLRIYYFLLFYYYRFGFAHIWAAKVRKRIETTKPMGYNCSAGNEFAENFAVCKKSTTFAAHNSR